MTVKIDTAQLKGMIKRWLWLVWEYLTTEVRKNVKVDTGEHQRSIQSEVNWLTVRIYSDTRQAVIEEFGRRPGRQPPLDALVWRVIRHFWLPGTKTWSYDQQPFETKRAIRNVARAIGRRGIKAKKTYSKTIKAQQNNIIKVFKKWLS